ncbi:DUF58 domain-containing protein [Candidatus Sumerlaeota bacterium]|nr:DUF58 domain-containing protein [Candidatus Sumerlaeota bacterium]
MPKLAILRKSSAQAHHDGMQPSKTAYRRPGWLSRFYAYCWHFKITRNGRYLMLSLAAALSVSVGSSSFDIPLYQIVFALSGLLAGAFCLGALNRPRIELKGDPPRRITARENAETPIEVINRSRFPALEVSVGFVKLPPGLELKDCDQYTPLLLSGESIAMPLTLRAARRGYYELPPMLAYSCFPFNLFRFAARRHQGRKTQPSVLYAAPQFRRLTSIDVPMGLKYQPGGIALTSNIGESPEYIGNREYRYGDPLRRIDFKSWGRLARPIVREYHEEYYCRIALALDTFVPGRRPEPQEGFPQLEAAISITAAIADALSRGEYLIDLFAAGPELYTFRAGRNVAHLDNMLEILACVEPCRFNPFEAIAPPLAEELGNITTMIGVFLDWDETREQLVRAAVEAGCSVKLIVVRNSKTTRPLDQALEFTQDVRQLSADEIERGALESL